MNNDHSNAPDAGRRRFLQLSGAGLAIGSAPMLLSCGGGDDGGEAKVAGKETRTYYFSLPGAQPQHEYFLVAGTVHHKLLKATPEHYTALRADIPNMPPSGLSHVLEGIPMSAKSPQMCYIKAVTGPGSGDWTMHSMMYHVPQSGVAAAATLRSAACKSAADLQRQAFTSCPDGSAAIDALIAGASFCNDPQYDKYKDYFDHAVALISHHPEIGSFDAATLSYVQQNIICADPGVFDLAVSLVRQGEAKTTPGGWATLVPFVDPNTGKVRIDAHGQQVCSVVYSEATLNLMGLAMQSVLPTIKNDPNLGVNITNLPPDQIHSAVKGKMWAVRHGTPTAPGAGTGSSALFTRTPVADAAATFTARDVSAAPGMSITNFAASGRTVSFTITNWYLRYLGLYARFLDGNGVPIALSKLSAADTAQFPISSLNGTFDGFMSIVNQELVILGIPVKQNTQDFSIKVPDAAASVKILCGGLGVGVKDYPQTTDPGTIMTAVLDLALPGIFLTMAAVSGYASLSTKLSLRTKLLTSAVQIFIAAITDLGLYLKYDDAKQFTNLIIPIGSTLLKSAPDLYALVVESLVEGEAEGAAEDCLPFGIGLVLQAVMALATAAQIIETGVEISRSPWTYDTVAAFTHDLTVTINHDPKDVAGFPATAANYRLIAICDGSSPRDSGLIAMPGGTRTAPLTYTFKSLPSGGHVNISVAFKTANDTLVGAGSTGSISNVANTASITIEELLVPLTTNTRYLHKQKTAIDAAGRHIWSPTTTAPPAPALNCGNPEGNLCELVGITLSEPFGAVGYSWKASSKGVTSFTGATGQLHQFANISFTENPQAGYMTSGVGFPLPARLAYDRASPNSNSFYIDTTTGKSLVRRINMIGVDKAPTIDGPGSNRTVGQFNFASDAFLIHPTGKLISFNSASSKMEVLTPSEAPTTDANAVTARSLSGPGSREGLLRGPVCAAVAPDGSIYVIEAGNNRIQAFDTGANPAPVFGTSTTMPLRARNPVTYLDLTVEFTGYIYVLLLDGNGLFVLDIYKKDGSFLSSTTDMRASKLAIDLFRNTYTLNFENIGKAGVVEPSVSLWIPNA